MKRASFYSVFGSISATLGLTMIVIGTVAAYRGDTPRATLFYVAALLFERDFRMRERQLAKIRADLERDLTVAARVIALPELLTQAADRLDLTIGNEDLIVPMRKIAVALREGDVA